MHTRITARHFDARPNLRTYATDRLGKLERFYDGITDAHVVLARDGNGTSKHVEICLNVARQRLRIQRAGDTHEAAIDRCIDGLRRQLLKHKAKLRSKNRNAYRSS